MYLAVVLKVGRAREWGQVLLPSTKQRKLLTNTCMPVDICSFFDRRPLPVGAGWSTTPNQRGQLEPRCVHTYVHLYVHVHVYIPGSSIPVPSRGHGCTVPPGSGWTHHRRWGHQTCCYSIVLSSHAPKDGHCPPVHCHCLECIEIITEQRKQWKK